MAKFINQTRRHVDMYSEELFALLLWTTVVSGGLLICGWPS